MKLKLEEKDNKTLVGIFPGILDEVRNNIRDVRGANANAIAPNKDEQKVITANEKYARSMEDILWFGEDALIILQHYRGEITDLSAMLYIIKGFSIYANNRFKELDRTRKRVAGEQFYYYDDDGRTVLMGLNTEPKDDDEKMEDLSYTYNRFYGQKSLDADVGRATMNSSSAIDWVIEMIKTKRIDKLPKQEREKFLDLVVNVKFINKSTKMMNSLRKKSLSKEQYKICQSLFVNYNSFLERVYMECWAFKVNNNL